MQVVTLSLRLSLVVIVVAGVADLLDVLFLWFSYMSDAGSVAAFSRSRWMTFSRVTRSAVAAGHAVTTTLS